MKLFSPLYALTMRLAVHPHAPRYLAGLSFAESSFFPIPPDVMLAPMALAQPARAWRLALLTTVASVLGGALGYLIGLLAFDLIAPLLHEFGYWDRYTEVSDWFGTWGFWAIFIAGFSPIPYKLFTIAAGVIAMSFPLFLLASLIGRGARYFMVAGLMVWGGERMEQTLRLYIDRLGWITVIGAIIAYIAFNHSG